MQDSLIYSGWDRVCGLSTCHQMPVATVVFQQNTPAQSAILLESGWIKLVRLEQDGREQIVALCPPGSLLGAEALIADQSCPTTGITLSRCRFHSIPAPVFLNWVRTDPQFSWQIHRAFGRRINACKIRSAQLKDLPARLRLEQLLWQLLYVQNHNTSINDQWGREEKLFLPLQRRELAQMISVTPEHLSRLLSRMEKDGAVRREQGWLIVPDPERLWYTPEMHLPTMLDTVQSAAPDLPDLIIA